MGQAVKSKISKIVSGGVALAGSLTVALYARVSTDEQAENFSIPAQLELLRSYCRSMGYAVYGEYIDAGHSGTTQNRPDLQRLLRIMPP